MRPLEAMKWLSDELFKLDTKLGDSRYRAVYAHKDGIKMEFARSVNEKDDLSNILQPPMLQDKIQDLLQEVCSNQVSFNVKYYPNPVRNGMTRPTAYGPGRPIFKDGGWGYTTPGSRNRVLYRISVILHVEPIMAPGPIQKQIQEALFLDSWSGNSTHLKGKCESKLFVEGEQVVRHRYPIPGEVLYFVTSYAIPGGGGVRVLKVGKNNKTSFISIQAAIRAGA